MKRRVFGFVGFLIVIAAAFAFVQLRDDIGTSLMNDRFGTTDFLPRMFVEPNTMVYVIFAVLGAVIFVRWAVGIGYFAGGNARRAFLPALMSFGFMMWVLDPVLEYAADGHWHVGLPDRHEVISIIVAGVLMVFAEMLRRQLVSWATPMTPGDMEAAEAGETRWQRITRGVQRFNDFSRENLPFSGMFS